jgi:hypothetical protein
MLFKTTATVKVNKTVLSMSLAHGFHVDENTLTDLIKSNETIHTMEGPPCDLDPDENIILLTTHFKTARGGTHLTKVVWSLPKRIGDEWCDLLYKWAAQ